MQEHITRVKTNIHHHTFTVKKIRRWVEDQCRGKVVLNLFAGPTRLEGCIEITNDLDSRIVATYHGDALTLIDVLADLVHIFGFTIQVILLDPPYSYRKAMEYYNGHWASRFKCVLDAAAKLLAPDGKVICFGYHASQMGESRGFFVQEIVLFDHSGAMHTTIACVEMRHQAARYVSFGEAEKILSSVGKAGILTYLLDRPEDSHVTRATRFWCSSREVAAIVAADVGGEIELFDSNPETKWEAYYVKTRGC